MNQALKLSQKDFDFLSKNLDLDNPELNFGTVVEFLEKHKIDSVLSRQNQEEDRLKDLVDGVEVKLAEEGQSDSVLRNNITNEDTGIDSVEL